MSRQLAIATLSILNAATKSASIQSAWGSANAGKVALDHAAAVTIKSPAALTGAVSVEVAMTNPSVDADFSALKNDDGTDVVLIAGRTQIVDLPSVTDLRLSSSIAEGAQRDFVVALQEDIG